MSLSRIDAEGNTKNEINSITEANWTTFKGSKTTLDIAMGLKTTDDKATPIINSVVVRGSFMNRVGTKCFDNVPVFQKRF